MTPSVVSPSDPALPDYGNHPGLGDWRHFGVSDLQKLYVAAERWAGVLRNVEKPWLCWHVNRRWCLLQQRAVREFGWTPVVGADPRFGPPALMPGAVLLDFNADFGYPIMFPLFPLEFVFLYARKLAFWHSDLILRPQLMELTVNTFEKLNDGALAAPLVTGGRRHLLNFRRHRYWDLLTCTTRGASESQFRQGAGWWKHFAFHPNCRNEHEHRRRAKYYYDFGTGIAFWRRKLKGPVVQLDLKPIEEGHCTSIGNPRYHLVGTVRHRLLDKELDLNFSLDAIANRFGIEHWLRDADEVFHDGQASDSLLPDAYTD